MPETRTRSLSSTEELDAIEPLWNSLRQHYEAMERRPGDIYPRAESWRRRRRTYEAMLADPDAFIVVLEEGEQPVAYAAVRIETSSAAFTWSERAGVVETFVVDSRRRGGGLGRRLLDVVRSLLRERGVEEIQLLVVTGNDDALDFYRRAGFRTYCVLLSDSLPDRAPSAEPGREDDPGGTGADPAGDDG